MSWEQFERWRSRHPVLFGLLVAAVLAIGLTFRWLRYDDEAGLPLVWVIAFAIATPVCILMAWRAGRRLRKRTEHAKSND